MSTIVNPTPDEQPTQASNLRETEDVEAPTNLSLFKLKEDSRSELRAHVMAPYDIKTPPEKVKKRPDGYDYVESSYMDYQAKNGMLLYKHRLLFCQIDEDEVYVIVDLEDRLTGNTELGADGARIMGDKGNAIKSALSKAIKNAQSRFGYSADVYQRRESVPTDEERTRYDSQLVDIKSISPARAKLFSEQWADLGTDWSEFLDKWQIYIDRNKPNKAAV